MYVYTYHVYAYMTMYTYLYIYIHIYVHIYIHLALHARIESSKGTVTQKPVRYHPCIGKELVTS